MNDRRFDLTHETRRTFGILPSLFWENPEGRAVQAGGKDAVIVSCYLRANRHATMLGLYRLRLDDVAGELPVIGDRPSLRAAFRALRDVQFAEYDEANGVVWVRDMGWQRLNLAPGRVIDPEDGRRVVVQRLFDTVPPTPLVERFFAVYGVALRLAPRTFAQPTLDVPMRGPASDDTSVGALGPASDASGARVASESATSDCSTGGAGGGPGGRGRGEAPGGGGPSPGTSTRTEDLFLIRKSTDQQERSDQEDQHGSASAAAPPQREPDDDRTALVTEVVAKDILPRRLPDHAVLAATIARCRDLGIPCPPEVARKAIESALFRYYRELRQEFELPPDPRGIYHDHVPPREPRLPMPLEMKPPPAARPRAPQPDRRFDDVATAARKILHEADLALKYFEAPIDTLTDLVEATKRYCANYKIDYGRRDLVPFELTQRACASEWAKWLTAHARKLEEEV